MNSPLLSPVSASRSMRWSSRLFLVIAGLACSTMLLGQDDPAAAGGGGRNRRGQNGGNGGAAGADARGGFGGGGGRGNFDPAQMQQQQMDRLREQFEVTDDAEWKLISDRITAITEVQQSARGGGIGGFAGGGRGGPGGAAAGGGRGNRGGNGNVELTALRQAITDKLPEAEIKARLDRLRESRKSSEEKLIKAQEDLRAVLSVRQEAVAVMSGLLP